MSKMIVYICVVWITGSQHSEGITRCLLHESQVKYETLADCKADREYSINLLRLRIRQEFGDVPEQIIIQPSCLEET